MVIIINETLSFEDIEVSPFFFGIRHRLHGGDDRLCSFLGEGGICLVLDDCLAHFVRHG